MAAGVVHVHVRVLGLGLALWLGVVLVGCGAAAPSVAGGTGNTGNAGNAGACSSFMFLWDVDDSAGMAFGGDPVVVNHTSNFYGYVGLMPRYYPDNANGTCINGGLPQLGNLSAHLAALQAAIEARLPDPNVTGVYLLDYESWRADWNSTRPFYQELSLALVRKRQPSLPAHEVEAEAMREFEAAAKVFLAGSLDLAQRLRPSALWGFYAYPRNSYTLYTNATTAEDQRAVNERISWIFKRQSVLVPSIYLPYQHGTPALNQAYVASTLAEAKRMRAYVGAAAAPIVPIAWYRYDSYPLPPPPQHRPVLTAADMETQLLGPVQAGVDGVLIWGAVSHNITTVQAYYTAVMSPIIRRAARRHS